ncbi:methyl-accepting chemotaxis protein [Pseudoalteromonas rubra]|uniref:Methyl-accepting chemotaxis protein n=1 Tax=Pseudoalteromonas rubra TaxID=43658 RepID=A0A8T0C2L7_9GAMM|nr:methyl-accepting chemotaxis protein [Pseudoalteromonas rubra]KAF7783609.1 methyl-accepting chemotaxis protein [Pseudoalteromonas rubra]
MKSSLKVKLLGPMSAMLAMFAIVVLAMLFTLHTLESQFVELKDKNIHAANQGRLALSLFKTQVQEWKNVLIRSKSVAERNKYWQRFLNSENEVKGVLENIAQSEQHSKTVKTLIAKILKDYGDATQKYKAGYDIFLSSGLNIETADQHVKGIDRALSDSLVDLVQKIDEGVDADFANLQTFSSRTSYTVSLISMLTAVVGVAFVLLYIQKVIVRPIGDLNEVLKAIAEGDYTKNISHNSNDEIGELVKSARYMQEKLSDSVGLINLVNHEVSTAFAQLSEISDEIGNSSVSQSKIVDSLNQATARLSTIAEQNKMDSKQAFDSFKSTSEATAQCAASLDLADKGMGELVGEMQAIAGNIEQLESRSSEIVNVLQVIQNIAEQTNLLALNAAIEAARAGEQGRGFAVVADEVRSLATRTQNSTLEIKDIIDGTLQSSQQAVSAIQSGLSKTTQTAQSVAQVSSVLSQTSTSFDSLITVTHSVDDNAVRQQDISQSIVEDVAQMLVISETLEKMAQSDEVSVAVNKASVDLQSLVERLSTNTGEVSLF